MKTQQIANRTVEQLSTIIGNLHMLIATSKTPDDAQGCMLRLDQLATDHAAIWQAAFGRAMGNHTIAAEKSLMWLTDGINADSPVRIRYCIAKAHMAYNEALWAYSSVLPQLKGRTLIDFLKVVDTQSISDLKDNAASKLIDWTLAFSGAKEYEGEFSNNLDILIESAEIALKVGDPQEMQYVGSLLKKMVVTDGAIATLRKSPAAMALLVADMPHQDADGKWMIPGTLSFALRYIGKVDVKKAGIIAAAQPKMVVSA